MGPVIGGISIILRVFVLCVAISGIFRFEYALNRVHVVAKCDTLGGIPMPVGFMIFNEWNMEPVKVGLILLFIWTGNPAASYMVARVEVGNDPDLGKECGVSGHEGG